MGDPASDRVNWAAEERDRRDIAEKIARTARRNAGSRKAARLRFMQLKKMMEDLTRQHQNQEYWRAQREKRDAQECEQQHEQQQGQQYGSGGLSLPRAHHGSQAHGGSAEEEARKFVPSLTKVLSGEYDHPATTEKHARRLCAALWDAVNHQYNPEAAARNLLDKCLLCLDEAVEWPPTAPAPPPPLPGLRAALQPPAVGSLRTELTGRKGPVVDVLRVAVRLVGSW